MTAPTRPCCTPVAALAGKPSEVLSQVSVILGMVLCGTATHVEDPVIRTLGDDIHQQRVSAKLPAAAIFRVVITCLSGAIGVTVTGL